MDCKFIFKYVPDDLIAKFESDPVLKSECFATLNNNPFISVKTLSKKSSRRLNKIIAKLGDEFLFLEGEAPGPMAVGLKDGGIVQAGNYVIYFGAHSALVVENDRNKKKYVVK